MQALNNFPMLDVLIEQEWFTNDTDIVFNAALQAYDHLAAFVLNLPFYDQMADFFERLCMQICALLRIASSYYSVLLEQFKESGYEEKLEQSLEQFSKVFISFELMFAKVEIDGYAALLKTLATLFASMVDQIAPMKYRHQLNKIVIDMYNYADEMFKAGDAIEAEEKLYGQSIDLSNAGSYIRKAVTCFVDCIKEHSTELLLNGAFSIVAGQLWSEDDNDHMSDTFKIFFTNLAAAAFVHYGIKRIHDFKDFMHNKFSNLFDPMKKFDQQLEEELSQEDVVIEHLMAF